MNHTKDARRIGLVDVDGHNGFPNLALMRISAWHKALGDMVEWWDGMLPYDRIYMSKVFTFSPDNDTVMQSDEIIRGGTGYRDYGSLPEEIEAMRRTTRFTRVTRMLSVSLRAAVSVPARGVSSRAKRAASALPRHGRRSSVRTAGRSFFWTIMCWRTSTVCNR